MNRFTPLAAVDPPDGLWLDLTGCAHLWDGEAGLMDDLAGRLERQGIPVRVAVADTFGAAWAVARYGGEARAIVPPGGQRDRLPAQIGKAPCRDSVCQDV